METRHFIGTTATKEAMFEAMATTEGLTKWWATKAKGNVLAGQVVELEFDGLTTLKFKCDEVVKNKKLVLVCFQSFKAWNGTKLIFNIEKKDQQVFLTLIHQDIAEDDMESYTYFSTKWTVYLLSLKQYLEIGVGTPYPKELKLYHGD
ncbi:SRPBCC family protein [Flagellimonas meishanensis]|uniref:SRPBCC family protein n=1 Tax=Flagellimonas meishanensis TaxID=2873264 RepID=UPI001CA61ED3|nr:SRPBCC domain-containing protein [[Muricauda] meishanensis]